MVNHASSGILTWSNRTVPVTFHQHSASWASTTEWYSTVERAPPIGPHGEQHSCLEYEDPVFFLWETQYIKDTTLSADGINTGAAPEATNEHPREVVN